MHSSKEHNKSLLYASIYVIINLRTLKLSISIDTKIQVKEIDEQLICLKEIDEQPHNLKKELVELFDDRIQNIFTEKMQIHK